MIAYKTYSSKETWCTINSNASLSLSKTDTATKQNHVQWNCNSSVSLSTIHDATNWYCAMKQQQHCQSVHYTKCRKAMPHIMKEQWQYQFIHSTQYSRTTLCTMKTVMVVTVRISTIHAVVCLQYILQHGDFSWNRKTEPDAFSKHFKSPENNEITAVEPILSTTLWSS